jgi:hypothetical protein
MWTPTTSADFLLTPDTESSQIRLCLSASDNADSHIIDPPDPDRRDDKCCLLRLLKLQQLDLPLLLLTMTIDDFSVAEAAAIGLTFAAPHDDSR